MTKVKYVKRSTAAPCGPPAPRPVAILDSAHLWTRLVLEVIPTQLSAADRQQLLQDHEGVANLPMIPDIAAMRDGEWIGGEPRVVYAAIVRVLTTLCDELGFDIISLKGSPAGLHQSDSDKKLQKKYLDDCKKKNYEINKYFKAPSDGPLATKALKDISCSPPLLCKLLAEAIMEVNNKLCKTEKRNSDNLSAATAAKPPRRPITVTCLDTDAIEAVARTAHANEATIVFTTNTNMVVVPFASESIQVCPINNDSFPWRNLLGLSTAGGEGDLPGAISFDCTNWRALARRFDFKEPTLRGRENGTGLSEILAYASGVEQLCLTAALCGNDVTRYGIKNELNIAWSIVNPPRRSEVLKKGTDVETVAKLVKFLVDKAGKQFTDLLKKGKVASSQRFYVRMSANGDLNDAQLTNLKKIYPKQQQPLHPEFLALLSAFANDELPRETLVAAIHGREHLRVPFPGLETTAGLVKAFIEKLWQEQFRVVDAPASNGDSKVPPAPLRVMSIRTSEKGTADATRIILQKLFCPPTTENNVNSEGGSIADPFWIEYTNSACDDPRRYALLPWAFQLWIASPALSPQEAALLSTMAALLLPALGNEEEEQRRRLLTALFAHPSAAVLNEKPVFRLRELSLLYSESYMVGHTLSKISGHGALLPPSPRHAYSAAVLRLLHNISEKVDFKKKVEGTLPSTWEGIDTATIKKATADWGNALFKSLSDVQGKQVVTWAAEVMYIAASFQGLSAKKI